MATLNALLKKHAIKLAPDFSGQFIRNGSQWLKGQTLTCGSRTIQLVFFGDFARSISEHWYDATKLTSEEQAQINQAIQEAATQNRQAREDHWQAVQPEVEKEWESFSELGTTPYLDRKEIRKLHGCRVEAHELGARLIVPARDVDGKLWGYQRIYSEKLSDVGTDKIFRKGAKKEGCFHLLGELPETPSVIYLAEGISTAVAVFTALEGKHPVVSCFDAGNVVHVARAMRAKYPDAHFVFCADNDRFPGKDGKVYHTGKVKAELALKEVGNGRVVLPQFTPEEDKERPTDFDDLARLSGLEAVKEQILNPRAVDQGAGLHALEARTASGLPTKPGERSVAMRVLEWYGDNLLVQNRDVFIYRDGYWQHQSEDQIKYIKRQIAHVFGPKAGIRDIENAYKYFLVHAPTATRDMFRPEYWSANFTNGTLHFIPNPGGKPRLDFRPHAREDFHISQLPFEFPGLASLNATNAAFDAMIARVWKDDPDFEGKRRVLAQLMGSCLMPCYPKIFFLVGPRGSGKSTIIKLINRLIDPRNVSRVDPSHFAGFNMETMPGKLVNMDPDIDLHKPIKDDIIKTIIDRIPFRVSRKFQTDLLAPLPPIHIFGGNDLPLSMEGATGAYERRVVILRFGAFSAEALGTAYKLDFDEWVWGQGWQGILAFALRGLQDLIESEGHFAVPESSKRMVKEWDARSDRLAQFLDAVEHKEVDKGSQYFLDSSAQISRKELWECFASWQEMSQGRAAPWNPSKLVDAMQKKGFGEKKIKGVRYWVGIGARASEECAV